MCDVSREIDDVLIEVLEQRYKPKNPRRPKTRRRFSPSPKRRTFHTGTRRRSRSTIRSRRRASCTSGRSSAIHRARRHTVNEPFLNAEGRKAYRAALLAAYDTLQSCTNDFDDDGRIARIGRCIMNAAADIETLELGKT
jgi:hypothetical protein